MDVAPFKSSHSYDEGLEAAELLATRAVKVLTVVENRVLGPRDTFNIKLAPTDILDVNHSGLLIPIRTVQADPQYLDQMMERGIVSIVRDVKWNNIAAGEFQKILDEDNLGPGQALTLKFGTDEKVGFNNMREQQGWDAYHTFGGLIQQSTDARRAIVDAARAGYKVYFLPFSAILGRFPKLLDVYGNETTLSITLEDAAIAMSRNGNDLGVAAYPPNYEIEGANMRLMLVEYAFSKKRGLDEAGGATPSAAQLAKELFLARPSANTQTIVMTGFAGSRVENPGQTLLEIALNPPSNLIQAVVAIPRLITNVSDPNQNNALAWSRPPELKEYDMQIEGKAYPEDRISTELDVQMDNKQQMLQLSNYLRQGRVVDERTAALGDWLQHPENFACVVALGTRTESGARLITQIQNQFTMRLWYDTTAKTSGLYRWDVYTVSLVQVTYDDDTGQLRYEGWREGVNTS